MAPHVQSRLASEGLGVAGYQPRRVPPPSQDLDGARLRILSHLERVVAGIRAAGSPL